MQCQIGNRVATMQQNAIVTIDIGDLGFAGGGREKSRVVGEIAMGAQSAHIDNFGAFGADQNWQLDGVSARNM